MSRSSIYAVNTSTQMLATGGQILLNNVIRRYGCNVGLYNGGVVINGAGYYNVDFSVSFNAGAGTTTVQLYKNGEAIPGALATITTVAATDYSATIPAMVREFCSCDGGSAITAQITGDTINVINAAMVVEKV